jgi:lysine biosynthesis protein LysW
MSATTANYRTAADGTHRLILSKIIKQICPHCGATMKLAHSELEDVVDATCPKCNLTLEVSCNLVPTPLE